jgi:hypothetical protein
MTVTNALAYSGRKNFKVRVPCLFPFKPDLFAFEGKLGMCDSEFFQYHFRYHLKIKFKWYIFDSPKLD